MSLTAFRSIPPGNYWAAAKEFFNRGGFINGLNPTVVGRIWYVSGEQKSGSLVIQGSNSNNGRSPLTPLATIAKALTLVDQYDIIVVDGVFREQCLAPLGVFDVTIIGAANRPRQATSSGIATGGGSFWTLPATSPTAATALLTLREQGWRVSNICFTPYTSSPCIEGIRAESATYPDPSHLIIDGCRFAQGTTGIGFQDSGGLFNVLIQNNIFQALTTAIKGVAGAGIANPLMHKYLNNYFQQNTNDIVIGCAYGVIQGNTHKNTTTKKVSLTAGDHEVVTLNIFDDNAADIDPAHGYDGSTTGTWSNYTKDQAALVVGQPA